ncbi:MAG: nucleoside recognition domain-containing protein, partial [Oscillospiraceae bacterium]
PLFAPLGFTDWRASTALITGISAKEAVVSTLSVLMGTGVENLNAALGTIFTPLSALCFLVFTLLYTPCVAAIAAIKREMHSGVMAIVIVLFQSGLAWLVAFAVHSVGMLLGFV